MLLVSTFAALLATIEATRSIRIKAEGNDDIYLESSQANNTVGYRFMLYQNVLSVMVNASNSKGTVSPATYAVAPSLILEYNKTIDRGATKSIYGFMNKANANRDWGQGLHLVRRNRDVIEIHGNWTSPDNNRLKFHARMFIASRNTTYAGFNLVPDEITMLFSILDYPHSIAGSTLAFDQLLLSGVKLKNLTLDNAFELNSANAASLFINNTALVDGKAEAVSGGVIGNDQEISITAGNSTSLNITGLSVQDILLSFSNSTRAKNVTFQQRLYVNMSAMAGQSDNETNAAPGRISWFSSATLISCFVAVLPLFLL